MNATEAQLHAVYAAASDQDNADRVRIEWCASEVAKLVTAHGDVFAASVAADRNVRSLGRLYSRDLSTVAGALRELARNATKGA